MWRITALFILHLLCFPLFADQLIVEPDMGRAPLCNAMHEAHRTLYLVMYGLTDTTLIRALIQQKEQGVDVRVILEKSPYQHDNENKKSMEMLTAHGIPWHSTQTPFRFTHQKTLIIDGQKAIIMTFNFTHSTFKEARNFAVEVDNPALVHDIEAIFLEDWNHLPVSHPAPALIYSPTESRAKLLNLIGSAKYSLKIYTQSIVDYQIVGALAAAARQGVLVMILTSSPEQTKQIHYLKKAGVKLHRSHHYYIHAKAWIIDDREVLVGSINLTRTSIDKNRELAIVTSNPKIVQSLTDLFNRDWSS